MFQDCVFEALKDEYSFLTKEKFDKILGELSDKYERKNGAYHHLIKELDRIAEIAF